MKLVKVLLIIFFTCFSFYYTDQVISYSKSKDPIMIDIIKASYEENENPIDAVILENEIISGKTGNKVLIDQSYEKMKSYGKFNETLLVFDEVSPDITINDNYDKFVISGNKDEKEVAFIFLVQDSTYLKDILKILKYNEITGYFFVDGNSDEEVFSMISAYNNYLGNYGMNSKYTNKGIIYTNKIIKQFQKEKIFCFTTDDEEVLKICSSFSLNTIKENIISTSKPYVDAKKELKNGKIYVFNINNYLSKELNTIIKYIKQKGYKIVSVTDMLNV